MRGTLLAVVDPHARELQPIDHPRLTAIGVMVWGIAGLLAALAIWMLRLDEIGSNLDVGVSVEWVRSWAPVFVAISGLGAIAMVRPHRMIPGWQIATAAMGVAMYIPLTYVTWRIHWAIDGGHASVYFGQVGPDPERTDLRLLTAVLLVAVILGVRANARLLVARSLLMRTGRVDRQTLLGLVAAVGVGVIGDMIHKFFVEPGMGRENTAVTIGTFLIGVGGLLFTLGLVGVVVDCYRLIPVILSPPLSSSDVLGMTGAPTPARTGSEAS